MLAAIIIQAVVGGMMDLPELQCLYRALRTDLAQTADPPLEVIVLSFEGINFIDSQASESIGKIVDLARTHEIEIGISRLKSRVRGVLERDGVVDRLGSGRIYPTTYEAVSDLTQISEES